MSYGGKEYIVMSSNDGQGWSLELDGCARRAELVTSRPGELVLRLDHQLVRCRVARGEGGELLIAWRGHAYTLTRPAPLSAETAARAGVSHDAANLTAPMPGTLVKVLVSEGQTVREGQALMILEAMKMEHTVVAPYAGIVRRLPYVQGSSVAGGANLVDLAPEDA